MCDRRVEWNYSESRRVKRKENGGLTSLRQQIHTIRILSTKILGCTTMRALRSICIDNPSSGRAKNHQLLMRKETSHLAYFYPQKQLWCDNVFRGQKWLQKYEWMPVQVSTKQFLCSKMENYYWWCSYCVFFRVNWWRHSIRLIDTVEILTKTIFEPQK